MNRSRGDLTLRDEVAWNRDIDHIRELLQNGEDANARVSMGRTLLHITAENSIDVILNNLRRRKKIIKIDENNKAAYIVDTSKAAETIKTQVRLGADVVDVLLQYGADVDAEDHDLRTPLHLAAEKCYFPGYDSIKLMDPTLEGQIIPVAETTDLRTIELLLSRGANANAKDGNGRSPLHYASTCNTSDKVKVLLEHGANVNAVDRDDQTPLHLAVVTIGSPDSVRVLLDHGANAVARDINDYTPIDLAVIFNLPDKIKVFLEHGPNVDSMFSSIGYTALHRAALVGSLDEVVRLLLEQGSAAINAATYKTKRTPLHFATLRGSLGIVKVLLEHGADANAENENGDTPLHVAAGYTEIHKMSSKPGDETRQVCCIDDVKGIVNLLVEHGARSESRNRHRQTPALLASYRFSPWVSNSSPSTFKAHLELVSELFYHGANFNATDRNVESSFDLIVDASFIASEYTVVVVEHIKRLVALETAGVVGKDRSLFYEIVNLTLQSFESVVLESKPFVYTVCEALDCVRAHYKRCAEEVEKLGSVRILKDITLDRVLTLRDPVMLARISSNVDFRAHAEAEHLGAEFPIYSLMIRLQYRRALEMKLLCEKCETSLGILSAGKMNQECADEIIQYLSEIELKNLNEATNMVSTEDK